MRPATAVANLNEFAPDTTRPLGTPGEVASALARHLDDLLGEHPTFALQRPEGWFELHIVEKPVGLVLGITVAASHGGDKSWERDVLRSVARANDWTVLDPQTGETYG